MTFHAPSAEDILHIQIAIVLAYSMALCLRAGLFSLGPAAMAGIGAYSYAVIGTKTHISPQLAFAAAIGLTAVAGLVIALPLARIKGIYTAIATLAVVVIAAGLEGSLSLTGGFNGLSGYTFGSPNDFMYGVIVVLALGYLWLDRGRLGRRLDTAGTDPVLAGAVGFPIRRARIVVLVVSALIAGIAGASYAYGFGYVSSTDFGFPLAIQVAAFAVVGGSRHWLGPLIAAGVLSTLGTNVVSVGNKADVILGAVMIIVMVAYPGGLSSALRRLTRQRLRAKASS